MANGDVVAMCSKRRLSLLPERSAYVFAGDERGHLVSSCGTGLYGRLFRKSPIQANFFDASKLSTQDMQCQEGMWDLAVERGLHER